MQFFDRSYDGARVFFWLLVFMLGIDSVVSNVTVKCFIDLAL